MSCARFPPKRRNYQLPPSPGCVRTSGLPRAARAGSRPVGTQEYLVRHALESFLDRLNQTPHGDDFVLKAAFC